MSVDAKRAKGKSSVRPCPQGCGFSLHEKDFHEACPVCLGIVHARRALSEPVACESCRRLPSSTLERRVKFVEKVLGKTAIAQMDPLLSESKDPASSESGGEELLAEDPVPDWAEHMEASAGLAGFEAAPSEGASQPLPQLACYQDDDDVLDIGLDVHGLSEDEQEPLSSGQLAAAAAPADQVDTSFLALYRRAAEKLEVDWPSPPPAQKPSRFSGFFLPPEPTTVKNSLPMFPDFVAELTSTWNKPLSTRATVPGYGQFLDLDGAEQAGLVNPPPMEASLAAYLAPAQNHGVGGPTSLPSKHCRFSASQLEKIPGEHRSCSELCHSA